MCASYGLDPRFTDRDGILGGDQELLDELRAWAGRNDGETLLPTGINLRNLNPVIRAVDGERILQPAWWGYLVAGAPARFPSINTRSERLGDRAGAMPATAIVPATSWFELQKPQRQWFRFSDDADTLLAMAAVTQSGRTADGQTYTCYSIVMRPAPERLAPLHDRTPLLIPAGFVADWLAGEVAARELIDEALARSEEALSAVSATPVAARP